MNKYVRNGELLACILSGKIDTLNSSVLENEINENMKEGITSVVFDLQEVDYISSTFLRIVIKIVKSVGKENFAITNVQPSVLMVFKIANLTEIVTVSQ
ncbi:MAG: STAS domain-containing protein [Bacteroidota bacterium]